MSLGLLPGGSTGSIGSFLGFDGDGLGGADGLAELAGDTALLAAGVAPKGVLAPKPRRQGALFERVVDGGGLLEDGAQSDHETANEFSQKPTEKSFNKKLGVTKQPVTVLPGVCGLFRQFSPRWFTFVRVDFGVFS